jgi:predicted dinucleotide-binding enzyme
MTTFGIIGAGNIGSAVAGAVIELGHDVVIANSRNPETLADLVDQLGPRARAATAAEAAAAGDVAVVTVPLAAIDHLPFDQLAGKIVIDTNNYYPQRDGQIEALDRGETTTSQMLQERIPTAKVAKGFNHVPAADIGASGLPSGDPGRLALATASDHDDAAAFVTGLYDQIGFDTVNVGPLADSWRVERDQPAYAGAQPKDELTAKLARATRVVGS